MKSSNRTVGDALEAPTRRPAPHETADASGWAEISGNDSKPAAGDYKLRQKIAVSYVCHR